VDWVDRTTDVWACPRCDAFIDGATDEPFCTRCRRGMHRILDPADQHTLYTRPTAPSRTVELVFKALVYGVGGLLLFGFLVFLLSMAMDVHWRDFVLSHMTFVLLFPLIPALAIVHGLWEARRELVALFRSRKTRVVHGLEHATIAMLEEDGVTVRSGLSDHWGFRVDLEVDESRVDEAALRGAAEEAIRRVVAGDDGLTITRLCGTSLLVGVLLASLTFLAFLVVGLVGALQLPMILLLAGLGLGLVMVGRHPLGLLAQRYLTVSTDFQTASVGAIERIGSGGRSLSWTVNLRVD
jgi:hypothetical protein